MRLEEGVVCWRWLAASVEAPVLGAAGLGGGRSSLVGRLVMWLGFGVWRVLEELVRAPRAKFWEGFVCLCRSTNDDGDLDVAR